MRKTLSLVLLVGFVFFGSSVLFSDDGGNDCVKMARKKLSLSPEIRAQNKHQKGKPDNSVFQTPPETVIKEKSRFNFFGNHKDFGFRFSFGENRNHLH